MGSREAADAVLKIMKIAEQSAHAEKPQPTQIIELTQVPRLMHGKLIGKAGSNIKPIKAAHPDVNIIVPKATEGGHVRIGGPADKLAGAKQAVLANLGISAAAAPARASYGVDDL